MVEINRPSGKKPSAKMTPEKVAEIKKLLQSKQYFQHQIAAIANVNPGRVAEVKKGIYG